MRLCCISVCRIAVFCLFFEFSTSMADENIGSRFVYLDESDPYYPHAGFPKLTTPMWVGEDGVDAVILLSIDDMGRPTKNYDVSPGGFQTFLQPLIDRLKKIDGRAPITIFTCQARVAEPTLQQFLAQGLSLDCHSYTHRFPLLKAVGDVPFGPQSLRPSRYDFLACLQNVSEIPHNRPVAFRIPGCDAQNTNSPRYYTEIFPLKTKNGHFLTCDSSVMMVLTARDDHKPLPRDWLYDAEGRERFRKYVRNIPQTKHFANYIEGYPYPYVINQTIWEFPATVPCDSHGVHKHRKNSPRTVTDWKRAIDVVVRQQGLCTLLFHTIGYIKAEQLTEVIDYADRTYGQRVKFLNCREIHERLTKNLLAGQSLLSKTGGDNGIRLLDVNGDGFLDVVIGNSSSPVTRIWQPKSGTWKIVPFPAPIVLRDAQGKWKPSGIRFFTANSRGNAGIFWAYPTSRGLFQFDGNKWVESPISPPISVDGQRLLTMKDGIDGGVRFCDLNGDGLSDLIVNNDSLNALFFRMADGSWKRAPFALPEKGCLVNAAGIDQGLRFVDLDADGDEDLVFSNERRNWVRLFEGSKKGWSRKVRSGKAGTAHTLPPIVYEKSLFGVWFHSGAMVVENEFTTGKKDFIDRIPFGQLLREQDDH